MALAGAKPKADRSQVRNRAPVAEWTEVADVPFEAGPPLPDRDQIATDYEAGVPKDGQAAGWPVSTQRWWEVVRRMPHAKLWTPADWEYAIASAEVHARFAEGWRGCAAGANLHVREKMLGMTMDARRDLRIRYVPAKPSPDAAALPSGVTDINDYRGL